MTATGTRMRGKRAVPLFCLVVQVDKDGGGGDGSHGGALVEGRVGGDQIRTQVRTEHSCGENIHPHVISARETKCTLSYISQFLISSLTFTPSTQFITQVLF